MNAVTVILVSYNSAAVLPAALQSLPKDVSVIVIDNASRDDSARVAQKQGATVIRNTDNFGFGRANNQGLQAASTPYVLFLNPDARLRTLCLNTLLEAADSQPKAWLLVPAIYREDGTRFDKRTSPICDPAFSPSPTGNAALQRISFASGAAFLARREELLSLGGFDPEIFLFFEDDDLSRRVLAAGGNILQVTNAELDHAGGASSPPSWQIVEMKHWHLAWSERYVRLKHGLAVYSRWRLVECWVKLAFARLRGNVQEQAKQRGLFNGTQAALKGVRAQDIRANVHQAKRT